MKQFIKLILLLVISLFSAGLMANETKTESKETKQNNLESWQHFSILITTIDTMKANLDSLRTSLQSMKLDHERKQVNEEIDLLAKDLESLNTALEMLATGGADLSLFGVKVDQPFDLREELQSIFEPILVELRRLSERPRKIERLRSDLLYYQQRLEVAQEALGNLTNYRKNAPSEDLKSAFSSLENRWQRRHDDLQNRVNLVQFELDQILSPENKSQRDSWEALKSLFGGRLLNLAMAAVVMILTYALLSLIAKLYRRFIMKDIGLRKAFVARVGSLFFYLLTTLFVLLSGMAVFYVRGDWVLLGLFLIILAGAAWAIQKSLPRFLIEAKLILNLGPVKEGERVVFNNLPWLVSSLNFQATLHNPNLTGGTLQIPIKDLVQYHSRKFGKDEPWFPSSKGDWILLDGDIFGCVLQQTPELIEVQVLDAVKTYTIDNYLALNPYNLTKQGFTLQLEFGVDYQHQADINGPIKNTFEKELLAGLKQSPFGKYLQEFSLQFSKADESSLNYIAQLKFSGDAAKKYLEIPRTFQALAVDSCNKHQFSIPFKQITVHSA